MLLLTMERCRYLMLQRGKFSKKCGRLGGEWEANWVAEGGWEASWAPLGSILSTGRWSRDVCTIIKEVRTPHSVRHCISCAGAGCGERARARDRGAVPVRLLLLLLRQGLVARHRGAERGAAVLQGGRRDGGVAP